MEERKAQKEKFLKKDISCLPAVKCEELGPDTIRVTVESVETAVPSPPSAAVAEGKI
jgi:hypothetical protein